MLSLRQRLFIGISVVVLIIIGIILLVVMMTREDKIENPTVETPEFTDPTVEVPPPVFDDSLTLPPVLGNDTLSPGLASEDETARYVRQLAIDFTERFLSYSNQSRNGHIADVLPLVTAQMAAWIDTQGQEYSSVYQGSTTKVIVSRVDAITETTATVHIEAQQTLESSDGNERIYQTGRVELVNLSGEWYIDGLYWE